MRLYIDSTIHEIREMIIGVIWNLTAWVPSNKDRRQWINPLVNPKEFAFRQCKDLWSIIMTWTCTIRWQGQDREVADCRARGHCQCISAHYNHRSPHEATTISAQINTANTFSFPSPIKLEWREREREREREMVMWRWSDRFEKWAAMMSGNDDDRRHEVMANRWGCDHRKWIGRWDRRCSKYPNHTWPLSK